MIFTLEGEILILQNTQGTFRVNCREILKWLQAATIQRIDFLKLAADFPGYSKLISDESTISGSNIIIPAERAIQINSAGDFFALQSLVAKGVFANSNITLIVPRWNVSYSIMRTQHGLNNIDIKLVSRAKSLAHGSYEEIIETIRFNIERFWDNGKGGQIEMAREVGRLLKGKFYGDEQTTWDAEFMELMGKVLGITLGAEVIRSFVMLPIGILVNELLKYGVIDYASYANLNIEKKHYNWKGQVIPHYHECVKNASGLRSAAEYLCNDAVTGTNDLSEARKVVGHMMKIIELYLNAYFSHGRNANTKYNLAAISSDAELLNLIQEVLTQKALFCIALIFGKW